MNMAAKESPLLVRACQLLIRARRAYLAALNLVYSPPIPSSLSVTVTLPTFQFCSNSSCIPERGHC